MEYPEVKRLYKFRPLRMGVNSGTGQPIYNEFTVKMLTDHTAWLARPDTFNDPFDCNYRPIPPIMKEGDSFIIDDLDLHVVEARILSELGLDPERRHWERISLRLAEFRNDHIQELVKNYCVLSMSEEADHTLLWSHYANQHSGICIQYAREPNSVFDGPLSRPVRYRKHYFSVDHVDYLNFIKRAFHSEDAYDWQNGNNIITNSIFTKSEQWFYEKEWRVAMPFPLPNKGFNLKIDAPMTLVIFGCLTPKEDKEYVKELLGDSVRYYQAWMKTVEHTLEIIPEDEWVGRKEYYKQEADLSKYKT
ncbi:DUF2971 domain-containing protein [Vibrio crassostreae]|uniref:DUF2971 domain-containing protein n=1 Tax=Vibrio crassostreae TaxID=246167 RepID=UPI001B315345